MLRGYEIEGLLGRGGFASVYRGRRRSDGRPVAIKVACRDRPDAAARLTLESAALRAVGPPAMPEWLAAGSMEDGTPFVVTERLALRPLSARLAELAGPVALDELAARGDAILRCLAILHARGWTHRDLKPDNILIGSESEARLIDLGLCRSPNPVAAHLTAASTIVGTPEYMAPEQCTPGLATDARSDVYAMGVILYQMATGRMPFVGSRAEILAAHCTQRPQPASELWQIPAALDEVLLSCLAKDPARRFADGEALRIALANAISSPPASRPPVEPASRASPRPAGRAIQSAAVVLCEIEVLGSALRKQIASFGGQLAHVEGTRCAILFDGDDGGNPSRRAVRAARVFVDECLCVRAIVEWSPVVRMVDAEGVRRYVSPLFARADRYPRASDPAGVLVTERVMAALTPLDAVPVEDGRGLYRLLCEAGTAAERACAELAAAPLVGRNEVLEELLASARGAAKRAVPTIATVLGDAGCGKSHLASVLVERVRAQLGDVEIIHLTATEPLGGDVRALLRGLLLRVLDLPARLSPGETGELVRSALVARLGHEITAELWPAVALTLECVSRDDPRVAALRAAPGMLRFGVARAVGLALRRRAATRPVAVVLDDAQFADETTLDALEYSALAEAHGRLWICVLGRPVFERARPSWAVRAGERHLVRLSALSTEAAFDLCRQLLAPAEGVPREAITRIVQRTQGIPLLLVELVRGLKRDGAVRPRERGGSWFVATDEIDRLPDLPLVECLAQQELRRLPVDLASHAQLAALVGTEFAIAEMEGVLRQLDRSGAGRSFPLDAEAGARRLEAAGVLVRRSGEHYAFRHALVREAVARLVPETLRHLVHEAAYRFYRDESAGLVEEPLPRLAHHAAHSGLAREAAAAYRQLAESAAGRHLYLDAEQLFGRALESYPPSEVSGRLAALCGRGGMRRRLSRYDEALQDFQQACALAATLGDVEQEALLLLEQATALDWLGEYARSDAMVQEAERLAPRLSLTARRFEAELFMARGRSLWRAGKWVDACDVLTRASRSAEQLGDEGYETLVAVLLMRGVILCYTGRQADAAEVFEWLIRTTQEHGDRQNLAGALNNRRNLWIACRRGDRVIEDVGRALELARELGMTTVEYFAEFNLAEAFYQMGWSDEALLHARLARKLERSYFGERARPLSELLEARIHTFVGRLEKARAVFLGLQEHQRRARERGDNDVILLPPDEVLLTAIDFATRKAVAGDPPWQDLCARARRLAVEQEEIEVIELRALAAQRAGRPEEAKRHFQEALAIADHVPNLIELRIRSSRSSF